jgi:hypothetical protein
MTQHSANQRRFNPRPGPSFQRFGAGNDSVRVLLVAINRGPQPAAFLGSHPLQRLQVLLAAPGEEIEFDPLNTMARATAGAPPQLLPRMPASKANPGPRPRLVQGEILSDDNGRLYEKIGRHIRPLQRLFSGPRGEVLELTAEAQTEQRVMEPSRHAPDAEASKPDAQAKTRAEAPTERQQSPQRSFRRQPQRPGVAFGAPPSGGKGVIREPLPHECGISNAGRQSFPPEGATPNYRREPLPPEGGAPNYRREPLPPEGGAPNVRPNDRGLKTAIPEQWIKPWEFQISREEALYDMREAASSRSALPAFIRSLTNWFGNRPAWREAWRKWQALLSGKSPDEQLWSVRPPRGWTTRQAVRDWARQTLEQAGYEPRMMLVEWEIFWRRKGL